MNFFNYDKSIFRKLIDLSLPTMFAMLLQSVYDIVDMYWVGKISTEAISAVTLFSIVFWIFEFLNSVVGTSSVSMISQSVGRNDLEMKDRICEQTLTFKFLVGIFTACLMFLTIKPILNFYTDDTYVKELAYEYGRLRIFFIPIMFSSFSVNTIFRCTGDSKTPMKIMAFSAVVNMILDPIFMFERVPLLNINGFNLGTYGAAVATVISTSISFLIGFGLLLKGNSYVKLNFKNLFRIIPSIDKNLLLIGIPAGLENFLRFFFEAVMMKFVSVYGVTAITAAGICTKIYGLSMLPMHGLLMGGSVLAGMYLGDEDIKSTKVVAHLSGKLNAVIMFTFTVICCIFPRQILEIFSNDSAVIALGSIMLPVSTACIVFLGYGLGLSVVFTGSGKNSPLLVASIVSQWLLQIPIMVLFVYVLKLPAHYLWVSYIPSDFLFCFILVYFYRKGDWEFYRV